MGYDVGGGCVVRAEGDKSGKLNERSARDWEERKVHERDRGMERSVEPPLLRWGVWGRGPILAVDVPPRDVYGSGGTGCHASVINFWRWRTTTQPVDDM